MIGDDAGPTYFSVDSESGEISVARSLGETDAENFIVSQSDTERWKMFGVLIRDWQYFV